MVNDDDDEQQQRRRSLYKWLDTQIHKVVGGYIVRSNNSQWIFSKKSKSKKKQVCLQHSCGFFFSMFLFHCKKKKRKKPSSLLPPPPPSYHSANDDYVFKTTISTTTTTMKTTRKTFRFVVPFKHSHFILGCTIWTFSFSFSFFRHCVFHRISMDIFHSLCVYSFFFLVKSKITEPNYHHQWYHYHFFNPNQG